MFLLTSFVFVSRQLPPTHTVVEDPPSTFLSSNLQHRTPNSCICHTSEKSRCKSCICHTFKIIGLKVLCLPHIRENRGVGGVIVNQTSDEGCLSRATIGSEGSLLRSDEHAYPERAPRVAHSASRMVLRGEGPLLIPLQRCAPACRSASPWKGFGFALQTSNLSPPTSNLRHNPPAHAQHPHSIPAMGRIQ